MCLDADHSLTTDHGRWFASTRLNGVTMGLIVALSAVAGGLLYFLLRRLLILRRRRGPEQ
jgi:hypothetical protein